MQLIVGIIQIVIQILTFVAGLFGPPKVATVAYVAEYDCGQVQWTSPATVKNGVFSGTASVSCLFQGQGDGNISALKAHLVSQLPVDSGTSTVALTSDTYQGLPSITFPTALQMGSSATARGTTVIASDDQSTVRSIFDSSAIDASGAGAYLKSVHAEMNVVGTDGLGTYNIEIVHAIEVKKPFLISAGSFLSQLKSQSEKSLTDQAVSALQEAASHL